MSTMTVQPGFQVRPRTARPVRRVAAAPARLTRRGRLLVTLAVGALLAVAAVTLFGSPSATAGTERAVPITSYERVTVQQGQTLWALAETVAPDKDPREVVAEIMQLNALSSAGLQTGQVLLLPR